MKPSSDEFFESALNYLSGGKCDQTNFKSTNAKMELVAAMVYVISRLGRCLFILDSLDAMQDENGCIKNAEFKKFISYLIQFGHGIATSSNHLQDYVGCEGYVEHDIASLSNEEGRELLQKLGMKGSNEESDRVVNERGGQPFELSLIGRSFDKADSKKADFSILNYYREQLSEEDRALITMLSAIRGPIDEKSVRGFPIFLVSAEGSIEKKYQKSDEREGSIERLVKQGILIHNLLNHS